MELLICICVGGGGGGVKTPPGLKSLTNLSPTSVSSNASPQTVINPQDLDGDMH